MPIYIGVDEMPKPVINYHECTNCGSCADVCPVELFSRGSKIVVNCPEKCIGCRSCEVQCPSSAIKILDQIYFCFYNILCGEIMSVTKKMSIGEVVTKYPKSVEVMLKYGLHCVGCSVAAWESLEDGAKRHGLSDKDIDKMIAEINSINETKTKTAKSKKTVKKKINKKTSKKPTKKR